MNKFYILVIALIFSGTIYSEELDLVLVSGGTFNMGTLRGVADERKVYGVNLSGFYIGKFEVTQGEYESVMGYNPSVNQLGPNSPVNTVSWYDAVEFCNALSEKEGLTPCYTIAGSNVTCDFEANGYRLPTEAEWEYAARGCSDSQGLTFSGSKEVAEVAWYKENSDSSHPVGEKVSNELGLFDMSGNVAEWCWDWYGGYLWDSQPDPKGNPTGSYRVNRGGSWRNSEDSVRYSDRYYNDPYYKEDNLGFRVVLPE